MTKVRKSKIKVAKPVGPDGMVLSCGAGGMSIGFYRPNGPDESSMIHGVEPQHLDTWGQHASFFRWALGRHDSRLSERKFWTAWDFIALPRQDHGINGATTRWNFSHITYG